MYIILEDGGVYIFPVAEVESTEDHILVIEPESKKIYNLKGDLNNLKID
jgi:hypothetical protein